MQEHQAKPQLLRALGLREGVAIHIGSIIGSGIFIVPAIIAGRLQAFGPILLVWFLGGLLALFGALTLAELSSILPQAGGYPLQQLFASVLARLSPTATGAVPTG